MGITIHRPEINDEKSWRTLWRGYLDFYETELPDEIYRNTWRRMLSGDLEDINGLLAKDETGKSVGLVHYLFHPHCWHKEKVCYLQDLFVDDSARGKGVGRLLINRVYEAADTLGRGEVYWLTQTFNSTARQLYNQVATVTPFIKYKRN